MLLCTWISNCPIAVTHFLHNQENVPFVSLKSLAAMSDVYEEKCLHLIIVALKITLSCKCAFRVLSQKLKPEWNETRTLFNHVSVSQSNNEGMNPWLWDFSSWRHRSQRTWEKMSGWSRVCARCCSASASTTTTTRWRTTPSKTQRADPPSWYHYKYYYWTPVVHIYLVHSADVD